MKSLNAHGFEALVFEDWPKRPRETLTGALRRIIRVVRVRSFFILWPKNASLLGVNWELGILADRVECGRLDPRAIVLLVENGIIHFDLEEGMMSIGEPGNRTRYFDDLLIWQCPITRWSTYLDLTRRVLWRAAEQRDAEGNAPRKVSELP